MDLIFDSGHSVFQLFGVELHGYSHGPLSLQQELSGATHPYSFKLNSYFAK